MQSERSLSRSSTHPFYHREASSKRTKPSELEFKRMDQRGKLHPSLLNSADISPSETPFISIRHHHPPHVFAHQDDFFLSHKIDQAPDFYSNSFRKSLKSLDLSSIDIAEESESLESLDS